MFSVELQLAMTPAYVLLAMLCFKDSTVLCKTRAGPGASVGKTRSLLDIAQGLKKMQGSDYEENSNYFTEVTKIAKNLKCQKGSHCNTFSKEYRESVDTIKDLLVKIPTLNREQMENNYANFEKLTALLTPLVQNNVFMDALSLALLTRRDTKNQKPLATLDTKQATLVPGAKGGKNRGILTRNEDVKVDYRATSPVSGKERDLDFFREDVLLHVFHDMWHTLSDHAYPFERAGERFAYAHQHLLNRYHLERYLAGLPILTPLDDAARQRPFDAEYKVDLRYLGYSNEAFRDSVKSCRIQQKEVVELRNRKASTILEHGQGSFSKFGKEVLENYHNRGHIILSQACKKIDPRANPNIGTPMADSAGAARMPIFYRWHAEIEKTFQDFKANSKYTEETLAPASGLTVKGIQVETKCSDQTVQTFMEEYTLQTLKNRITYRRLNHEDFRIKIRLDNEGEDRTVIMRIYLLLDAFKSERRWFLELDRRIIQITQAPSQTINWYSPSNFLTMKDQAQFALGADYGSGFSWGWPCGWPHHLYLPKGRSDRPERFKILVFLNDPTDPPVSEGTGSPFTPHILCGSNPRDPPKPQDDRPMGFPLDQDWDGVDFMEVISNRNRLFGVVSADLNIIHSENRRSRCAGKSQRQGGRSSFQNNGGTSHLRDDGIQGGSDYAADAPKGKSKSGGSEKTFLVEVN